MDPGQAAAIGAIIWMAVMIGLALLTVGFIAAAITILRTRDAMEATPWLVMESVVVAMLAAAALLWLNTGSFDPSALLGCLCLGAAAVYPPALVLGMAKAGARRLETAVSRRGRAAAFAMLVAAPLTGALWIHQAVHWFRHAN